MVVHLQINGELYKWTGWGVMWRHLTNGHIIKENRHQNNVKAHINNEMFQRSLNLSNRTLKIDAKILDLLRRFKAGFVKVSASIRAVVGPFNEPSKLWVYLTQENISQTKWSCFEPNQPILTYSPQIGCNFNHYLAKQSLNWQNLQDGCPIVHRQRLWTIFLQWAFKFEILSTNFYKYAVLFLLLLFLLLYSAGLFSVDALGERVFSLCG